MWTKCLRDVIEIAVATKYELRMAVEDGRPKRGIRETSKWVEGTPNAFQLYWRDLDTIFKGHTVNLEFEGW